MNDKKYVLNILYKNGAKKYINNINVNELKDHAKTLYKAKISNDIVFINHEDEFYIIDCSEICDLSFKLIEKDEESSLFLNDIINENKKKEKTKRNHFNANLEKIENKNEEKEVDNNDK
jgi:hypothetical protein